MEVAFKLSEAGCLGEVAGPGGIARQGVVDEAEARAVGIGPGSIRRLFHRCPPGKGRPTVGACGARARPG